MRQSVWRMSAANSAPRLVGLIPTIVRARERGAPEEEDVLGHVLEQHADVEIDAKVVEDRRPDAALLHDR